MTESVRVPAPGAILHASSAEHYWRGRGTLSIKSFVSGRALYQVDSAYFRVGEGEYLILNEGHEYSITVDARDPVDSFCVFFEPRFVAEVYHGLVTPPHALLEEPYPPVQAVPDFVERTYPHDDLISPTLRRVRLMHRDGNQDEGRTELHMHELLTRLFRLQDRISHEPAHLPALHATTRNELYRRLHLARDYADAFLDRPVTVREMANVAGLSLTHLLRTFPALFGQTPHQYIMARRIARAKELLRGSTMPVTEICFAVGWQSAGSFSSLFHREVGISPSEYRRQFR